MSAPLIELRGIHRSYGSGEALVRGHLDLSRRNMAMYAAPDAMTIRP